MSPKSYNICKFDAKFLNVKASVCVSFEDGDASLKNHLKY